MTDRTEREGLRECPWCRKTNRLSYYQPCADGGWGVSCTRCHVTLDSRCETKAEASDAWNVRPDEVAPDSVGISRKDIERLMKVTGYD